jgi:small subunit ribosomal protein S25e
MGGTKRKPISQAEKSQSVSEKKSAGPQGSGGSPEKKAKEVKLAHQQAKQQALVMPRIDEKNLQKTSFGGMKAITVYGTAKVLGVNASVATAFLRNLESKNLLRKVGGFSGHYVYTLNSQM